ncbi:MAG: metallophosphoesterase [Enterococcus sp.]|nr:metallophosphoesterase [Enterococcus sp.]
MGKLAVISDLHADINRLSSIELAMLWQTLKQAQVTHLHLAGDIANHPQATQAVVAYFQKHVPTTYHWGNHEMVGLNGETEIEAYKDQAFLNFKSVSLNEETLLLGVNGWYDYRFSELQEESKIRQLKELYWFDRNIKRLGSDPQISEQINQRLYQTLKQLPKEKKIILSTHFVPKREFIVFQTGEHARWNQLNAFLGSEGFGEVLDEFSQVQHVIFGHTHRRFEPKKIKQTWYHCRPFGYYYEWQLTRQFVFERQLAQKYRPTKLKGVLKKHQSAFDDYKKIHLFNEFQQGITLIDY